MLADLDRIFQEANDDYDCDDDNDEVLNMFTECQKVPTQHLEPRSDELRKKVNEIFASLGTHDNGLSRAIFYANRFLVLKDESVPPTDENWRRVLADLISMDGLIKFYKTRRDAPLFVRHIVREFFETINWQESAPKQTPAVCEEYVHLALTCHRFFSALAKDGAIKVFYEDCSIGYELLSKHKIETKPILPHPVMDMDDAQEAEHVEQADDSDSDDTLNNSTYVQWASDEIKIVSDSRESGSILKRIYSTRIKPRLTVNEEIFDTLQSRFPHFAEVISFYKAQFRLNLLTGRDYIPPVLLLGPPGIGKTVFAKEFAKALATGYTFIDMASSSASWTLSGLTSSWNGAKPGKLVTAMVDSPTASPIVLLDEIEKSGTSGHGQDPRTPLYQLLEENTAKAFTDEFVDFPVDLSRIIYIACANSTDGLTEPLLTRFQIFEIADPSDDQHGAILESIYQAEVAGTLAFPEHLPHEVKVHLKGQSLRTAKVQISKAISSVLLSISMEELRSAKPHSLDLSVANFQQKQKPKKAMGF